VCASESVGTGRPPVSMSHPSLRASTPIARNRHTCTSLYRYKPVPVQVTHNNEASVRVRFAAGWVGMKRPGRSCLTGHTGEAYL
jgi:hypothetical protein